MENRERTAGASRRFFLKGSIASGTLLALGGVPFRAWGKGRTVLASVCPVKLLLSPLFEGIPEVSVDLIVSSSFGCPHDYALAPRDLQKVMAADAVVVNGGGFEPFVPDILREFPDKKLINAGEDVLSTLGVKPGPESTSFKHNHEGDEGHGDGAKTDEVRPQEEPQHGEEREIEKSPHVEHDEHHHHEHEHHHDAGINPHYFASPMRAAAMVRHIAGELGSLFPESKDRLLANAQSFASRLEALANELKELSAQLSNVRFVLEHDALDWLFKDAGLHVEKSVRRGGSKATSASLLAELVKEIKQNPSAFVLVSEPQFTTKIVDTLSKESGAKSICLDSLASAPQNTPLLHYEERMKENIRVLRGIIDER